MGHRRSHQRGQAFVEFALVLPLLLILLAAGADLARIYFLGIETSNGAAQAAMYVANNSSDTNTATAGPTTYTAAQLKSVVSSSYSGSFLSCGSISVTQNQSSSPTGPSRINSDTYPTSGSFYEYVTVTCNFSPLTPLIPVGLKLKSTSSDLVLEQH
jgi:Flp pilus assembly protein TadG